MRQQMVGARQRVAADRTYQPRATHRDPPPPRWRPEEVAHRPLVGRRQPDRGQLAGPEPAPETRSPSPSSRTQSRTHVALTTLGRARTLTAGGRSPRKTSVGKGGEPSGSIRQPLRVCRCGLKIDQRRNERPGGASPAAKTGSWRPTSSRMPGRSPHWGRYKRRPSGQTRAPVIDPKRVDRSMISAVVMS